jgi:hypothetical protein
MQAGVGAAVGVAVGESVGDAEGIATQAVPPPMPSVHSPIAHAWHSWYAALSWYLPDGQW